VIATPLGRLDRTYDGFFETPTAAICNGGFTSIPAVCCA